MTKFLNISTDTTLGGIAPSDELAVSQKAIKTYVDNHSGGGGLPDQTGHAGEFLTTDGTDASWSDAIGYHPDLFDHKWADHILNDVQWLRADTFSWQSGAVYQAAYQHLADDIDGKTLQSETVGGVTVQFYLADDGHKICPDSEESNVVAIYTATGVAWYYIIDTTNQRFKLPRTQYGLTGLRDTVGNYVAPGAPNITGQIDIRSDDNHNTAVQGQSGALQPIGNTSNIVRPASSGRSTWDYGIRIDASLSSPVYGASTTIQPPATQQYLYFYVGNFTQTALENTAGITAETLNNKVDKGHQVIEFQAPTAQNNYTWYRKYADGWVEQGGRTTHANSTGVNDTVTLPIAMSDTNYTVVVSSGRTDGVADAAKGIGFSIVSASSFYITMYTPSGWGSQSTTFGWYVAGMAA